MLLLIDCTCNLDNSPVPTDVLRVMPNVLQMHVHYSVRNVQHASFSKEAASIDLSMMIFCSHRQSMIVTILFAWCLVFSVVAMLVVAVICYRVAKRKCWYRAREKTAYRASADQSSLDLLLDEEK